MNEKTNLLIDLKDLILIVIKRMTYLGIQNGQEHVLHVK